METSLDAMVFLLPVKPLQSRELDESSTGMMALHVGWTRN
jgi:hypothetical protein